MSELRLIIGLGNPGKQYESTRHNMGFLVLQHLAQLHRLTIKHSSSCCSLAAEGKIERQDVCLLFPVLFMNRSGIAVRRAVDQKNILAQNILIVCDDAALPFGRLRLRPGGSDGGHNGLASVIEQLGTKDLARLRVGVANDALQKVSMRDFVLEPFSPREMKDLDTIVERSAQCCAAWLQEEMAKVMSCFNG